MQRLDSGRPLRAAMAEAGMSIPALARATRTVDPEGRGVSQSLIGFLCSTGRSQREKCLDHSGVLIAAALKRPTDRLFRTDSCTPEEFTLTAEVDGGESSEDA